MDQHFHKAKHKRKEALPEQAYLKRRPFDVAQRAFFT